MNNFMNFDFFKKLTLGRRQTSGVMHVIPIIGENLTNNMASFDEVKFLKTSDYGAMVFQNSSKKPFIIPSGYSIITKQDAQDHTLPHAGFIEAGVTKVFKNACCIQQTQPGYLDGEKITEKFTLLPVSIRSADFYEIMNKNDRFNFSRLWPHISEFQKDLVNEGSGNLVLFFNRYIDQLSSFTAEFEPVDYQIGAIIMINDTIIGIEIAPTHEYFKSIWDGLIRGAYGADVLSRSLKSLIPVYKQKTTLDLTDSKNMDDIFAAVQAFRASNSENLVNQLKELSLIDYMKFKPIIHDNGNLSQVFFSHEDEKSQILGEAFLDEGGNPLYLSMLFPEKKDKSLNKYLT